MFDPLELYKNVFQSLIDGILVVDRDCIVICVNDTFLKMRGIKNRDEIIGSDQNQWLLKNLGREALFKKVIQTGKPMYDIADTVLTDGSVLNRYVSVLPLYGGTEIIGGVAIFRDLKQISRHIDECKKSVKRIGNNIRTAHSANITFDDIIGESDSITQLKSMSMKAAQSELNILLLGESGVGKELFAQAIHNASDQKYEPFVTINCPSLSDSLVESELFGYEEGSFSGALRGGKVGLCEIADRGTLFLDEIGDLNLQIQAKILRLLETGEFLRVGGTKPVKVQIRIIAATNQNLDQLIEHGAFRRDLFYRLSGITIEIPPLRQRSTDIVHLISHFMEIYGRNKEYLDLETLDALCNFSWPGNTRELRNIIRSLVYLSENRSIPLSALPERIRFANEKSRLPYVEMDSFSSGADSKNDISVDHWEKQQIQHGLLKYGSSFKSKKIIAQEMGISISTLYNKIRQYSLAEKDKELSG